MDSWSNQPQWIRVLRIARCWRREFIHQVTPDSNKTTAAFTLDEKHLTSSIPKRVLEVARYVDPMYFVENKADEDIPQYILQRVPSSYGVNYWGLDFCPVRVREPQGTIIPGECCCLPDRMEDPAGLWLFQDWVVHPCLIYLSHYCAPQLTK